MKRGTALVVAGLQALTANVCLSRRAEAQTSPERAARAVADSFLPLSRGNVGIPRRR